MFWCRRSDPGEGLLIFFFTAWEAASGVRNLTVAVALEYESVLKRGCASFGLTESDIDDVLDAICSQAGLTRQYFLWRPVASDPNDDLVFEAAIASRSDFIITYNKRDFPDTRRFGIQCLTPKEFLILMRELP
jgi:predicted nucleic acid-binding protein